jgi:hypothetical protein
MKDLASLLDIPIVSSGKYKKSVDNEERDRYIETASAEELRDGIRFYSKREQWNSIWMLIIGGCILVLITMLYAHVFEFQKTQIEEYRSEVNLALTQVCHDDDDDMVMWQRSDSGSLIVFCKNKAIMIPK